MLLTNLLLVVEDEAIIRDVLEPTLTDAGFELVIAEHGSAALAELETDAGRFRALVTDINLGPGPDGWDVGRHARELVAEMPVVYMSGHSAQEWTSKGVPNSVLIAKPFAPAQIVTAVTALLNEADAHRTAKG